MASLHYTCSTCGKADDEPLDNLLSVLTPDEALAELDGSTCLACWYAELALYADAAAASDEAARHRYDTASLPLHENGPGIPF